MPATANFTQTRALSGGNLDDGYWNIELPWPIYFLNGPSFGFQGDPNIHVTTNGIIAPGLGTNDSTAYVINASTPNINKLVIAAADNYISSFQYKVIGTTPNRKAYIRYEGYQFSSTFANTPIIWEVVFSEQQSNQPTFIDVNVISNSRWGTQALYGLYAVGGTLVENPTNFGQPGLAWRLDLWYTAGLYVRTAAQQISTINVSKYGSLPGEKLSANRTLFIAGNNTNNFGTGSGVMMISKAGMPTDILANPQPYVQDLYFHSGLPYIQIIAKLPETPTSLTFPALARGIITWEDGGGGKKIICTKLYELGLMSKEIYLADQAFGDQLLKTNPDIYNGYRAWAEIVVDWMEGHGPKMMPWMTNEKFSQAAKKWSSTWAKDIATPWAEEMAYKMGKKDSGSLTGKLITAAGTPICKVVGVWQRIFGPSKKPAGFGKGLMLIPVFVMLKVIVELGRLIENKKSEST